MKKCESCRHSKGRGEKICYCMKFGIDIRRDYDQCDSFKSRFVLEGEHAEAIQRRRNENVRIWWAS